MNRKERIDAAIRCEAVDRMPWSVWFHFGLHFRPGSDTGQVHVDFFRHYQPDFLKVMNDYPYPIPSLIGHPMSLDDLKACSEVVKPSADGLGTQLECLDTVLAAVGDDAHVIDTIFDPWVILRQLVGKRRMQWFQAEHPDELKSALDGIARSMAGYVRAALERGLSGVFYSSGMAGRDKMTDSEYEEFCMPYDLIVLEASKDAAFNTLHIHGEEVRFNMLKDYPVHALSWAGQRTTPGMAEARALTDKCLATGLEETVATSVAPHEIREQVRAAAAAMGTTGTIIAPGCAVPPNLPVANIRAIQEAIEELAS